MISDVEVAPPVGVIVSGGYLWQSNSLSPSCVEGDSPLDEEWARRLDPLSVRAAWCVGEVRRLAGMSGPSVRPNREGVCVATVMGAQRTRVRYASRLVNHGLAGTNPIDFPDSIDGAPAAHVALRCNLQGPSFTLLGDGGGYGALVVAARQIVLGTADRMHVVVGDVFEPRVQAALNGSEHQPSSPESVADWVLALVLERHLRQSPVIGRTLLVGFMGQGAQKSVAAQQEGVVPAAPRNPQNSPTVRAMSIADAWLGLTAPLGSLANGCQDATALEGRHYYPLTNSQWPELAFVRVEKHSHGTSAAP